MPLVVHLATLEQGSVRLTGELSPAEMDWGLGNDPCLSAEHPLRYDLSIDRLGEELLIEGSLETVFECQCVRCLEPHQQRLELSPWTALIPLKGEDAVPVVNESVDLTPQIREDSLLALPQHPLCRPDCQGMPAQSSSSDKLDGTSEETRQVPSAWSVLDRLKLD